MEEEYNKAMLAADFIRSKTELRPGLALTLGTGLSAVSSEMAIDVEIDYADIPGFVHSTVQGHVGKLIIGQWAGKPVLILSGRQHYYEGYSMKEVTFSIRVIGLLGIEHFIFTNVAGGLHPDYAAGDLVFVRDHIYMMPENPLRGQNDDRFGPRFPDMSAVYNADYIDKGLNSCNRNDIRAHTGVYYCLQGPNLETPAEYKYIHKIGGDLVGMSTIPEVIVAKHMGRAVTVISIVSNVCYPPDQITRTTIEEVIEVASKATIGLIQVIKEMISG